MYLEFQCAYHSCTHIPYITFRHMQHTHAQSNSITFAVNERLVIIYVWFHSAPIQLPYFSVSFANRMKGPRETHDNSSHSALALTEQCAVVSGVNCDWRPAPHPPAGSSDFLSLLCQCMILTVQSPSIIHHHIYCLFEKSMSLISLTWSLGLKQYYLKPLQVFHYVLP